MFSRLRVQYALWEDSSVGRVVVKLMPLSLFSLVAIASVFYLEGKVQQVTAIQNDQNTVILAQKRRIDALEKKLAEPSPLPPPSPSPVPAEPVPTP